jgi:hypothetical protein
MINSSQLPAFQKEFKKLQKRYRSLRTDLEALEDVLKTYPTGIGVNFVVVHQDENVAVVKARLACATLRNRSLRVVYAYHNDTIEFVYLELYFKGQKENEDRQRIEEYLNSIQSGHKSGHRRDVY